MPQHFCIKDSDKNMTNNSKKNLLKKAQIP